MKVAIFVLLAAILCVISFGVYESHQERANRTSDEAAEARRTLSLAAQEYNLGECFKHLGVTELTADRSPKWRTFKRAHRITGTPIAMSDENLKDCLAVK